MGTRKGQKSLSSAHSSQRGRKKEQRSGPHSLLANHLCMAPKPVLCMWEHLGIIQSGCVYSNIGVCVFTSWSTWSTLSCSSSPLGLVGIDLVVQMHMGEGWAGALRSGELHCTESWLSCSFIIWMSNSRSPSLSSLHLKR